MSRFACSDFMRHKPLNAILLVLALSICPMPDLEAQPGSILGRQNPPSVQEQDAAAKAAERKKRFEEQRRRLEETTSNSVVPQTASGQTLFISPAVVNMVSGDYQCFSAFGIDGKTVTDKVQWSISDSSVAELSTSGDPTILSKGP